jgi:hypothetical protein
LFCLHEAKHNAGRVGGIEEKERKAESQIIVKKMQDVESEI